MGSIPGLGRSSGGGHGNPFQDPCLENPMNRGAWQTTVYGLAKSWTWLKWLSTCMQQQTHVHTIQRGTNFCKTKPEIPGERIRHTWKSGSPLNQPTVTIMKESCSNWNGSSSLPLIRSNLWTESCSGKKWLTGTIHPLQTEMRGRENYQKTRGWDNSWKHVHRKSHQRNHYYVVLYS